jgi:hypothetical protein
VSVGVIVFLGREGVIVSVGGREGGLLGERVTLCLLGERVLSCLLEEKVPLEERLESVQFQCCPGAMLLSSLSSGSRASWCRFVESQLNVPVRRVWLSCCFVLVLCKVSQVCQSFQDIQLVFL